MHPSDFTNLIVTYNSVGEVAGLLDDLRQFAPEAQTIVVDNASRDETAALIQARFPEVRLVENADNRGYARAVNQAFALSSTPYVFLINPDIRIGSERLFQELRICLEADPEVAVAAPLQFKEDGRRRALNFTWSYWTPRAFRLYLGHLLKRPSATTAPIRVSFLNAGCLFLRSAAFRVIGGFNEKYFLYGEEPDLFLKIMRHGFQCRLLPAVSVVHNRERSLATVSWWRRLGYKLRGGWNIVDALLVGAGNILLDRLKGARPGS